MKTYRPSRVIVALTAGIAVLALTSCAVQNTSAPDSSSKTLASVPGFDPSTKTISVGVITALSGPVAPTAGEQIVGQNAYWDMVNKQGGIAGQYKVKVVTADSQFDPQLAVQAYQKIRNSAVMLSGVLGDASTSALVPILDGTDGVQIPSSDVSASFNSVPSVAPSYSSIQTNVVNTITYLIDTGKVKKESKFCAMLWDNQAGDADLEALNYVGKKQGFTTDTVVKYAPTDASITAQVQQLKSAKCDVVLYNGAAANTPPLVAAATQLGFAPTWVGEWFSLADSFRTSPLAEYLSKNFVFMGFAGNLDDPSIPGIAKLTKQLGKTPTMQNVIGWVQGVTADAILEKAVALGDLSGKGLREAMTKITTIDYEGLSGDMKYGEPKDRELPQTTTIFSYDPNKPFGLNALKVGYVAPGDGNPKFYKG